MSGNQPTPTAAATLTPPTRSHMLQTHGVPPFRRISTVSRSSTCTTTVEVTHTMAATTSLVPAQRTPRGKARLWIWRGRTPRFALLPRRRPRIRLYHRHSRRLMYCLLIRVSFLVFRTVCTIAGRASSHRKICSCEKRTITSASARAGTGVRFEVSTFSRFVIPRHSNLLSSTHVFGPHACMRRSVRVIQIITTISCIFLHVVSCFRFVLASNLHF